MFVIVDGEKVELKAIPDSTTKKCTRCKKNFALRGNDICRECFTVMVRRLFH